MGLDAVGEFPPRLFFNLWRLLWLHQAAGALLHQTFQINAVNDVQRVEHVTLGLGHFLALAVAHQAVHVDLAEGHLLHHVEAHENHAGDPEEDDVEAGNQHAGGVIAG